jgi:thiol:disulfide interchange protein DsbD
LNYQVCKEVCINLEKKFTFHQMMQWQLLGKKELKMVPVGTGTVMEDALEPSLGASNSIVATPEKAWLQRLNQLQKEVCGQSFYCYRICGLLTPCVFR